MGFSDLVARVDDAAKAHLGGETILYQPTQGPPVEVTGIFDDQYVLAKGEPMAGVEAVGPAVFFQLEDLPDDPEDDDPILTIRDIDYRVVGRIAAGMGGIVLALRKVT